MLLMAEKGIIGGMCHAIHRYARANNKYMKDYDPSEKSSYLMQQDVNNLYEWAMSQKWPVIGFEWRKDLFRFEEEFIQNFDEDSNKEYILEVYVEFHREL